ncbi:hypothetical protein Ancab_028561 [Ancistrocladus abbreviatus]
MSSFRALLLKLPQLHLPKRLSISFGYSHSSTTTNTTILDPQLDSQSQTPPRMTSNPPQDPSNTMPYVQANSSLLCQPTQIHTRVIKTHFLESQSTQLHWNNIIRSYTRANAPRHALQTYLDMLRAGVPPDCYTLPITLKAVCQFCSIQTGRQFHAVMIHHGLEMNEFCESGLISMYCKWGEFDDAYKVFDGNADRKLGSWNAIIGGLSHDGRAKDALNMFIRMKRSGFEPDDVTMVSVIIACASLGDLSLALQLHKCVFQAITPKKDDVLMLNSLIDMYGKCGRMDLAYGVFSTMDCRNVSSWTSMIVAYASHGHVREAIKCFCSMREVGVVPNHVTFLGVLSACVHGGMVEDGKRYFQMMENVYGIEPQMKHFGCMVDLLGRASLLKEARTMLEGMPMKANAVIWGSLMGACERYSDVKMGEWVAKHLLELEPWNDGVYVVLSNIYASRNMWEEVGRIREVMKQRRLAKIPGYSLTTTSQSQCQPTIKEPILTSVEFPSGLFHQATSHVFKNSTFF